MALGIVFRCSLRIFCLFVPYLFSIVVFSIKLLIYFLYGLIFICIFQLEDGDIVCFQKSPQVGSSDQCRYPDVPSFLDYVHNRQVQSEPLQFGDQEFHVFMLHVELLHYCGYVVFTVHQHCMLHLLVLPSLSTFFLTSTLSICKLKQSVKILL